MSINHLQETDLDERFIQSLAEILEIDENAIREHLELGEGLFNNFPDRELIKKREFTHRKLIGDEKNGRSR